MESVACKHHELVQEYHHYALGTCKFCGQIRRYDHLDGKSPPTIIKIGRLNGIPVLEHSSKEVIKVVKNKPEVDSIAQNEPVATKRKYRARKPLRDFEADKEAIVEDYDTMPLKEFYAKQCLGPRSWTKLKKKWGVNGLSPRKAKSVPDTEVAHPVVGPTRTYTVKAAGELPAFPEFSDTLPMLTQIAWLETYKALKELKK